VLFRSAAFAAWVADQANPLTTRAIVNRVWLWHFGQPLAGNPNNFGSTGKKPTHPELLDWLAATFVEEGWSFKKLHRLITTSEAYRRSTGHPDRKLLAEKDPTGTSYAAFAPRRLTAEELRDAMLATTGELNPALGGIPNRPEMNLEAALQPRQVMGTFASAWVPNPLPAQRHRRSLYALKIRGLPDPAMEVFNQPTPDFSCERRDASTVTPQVFSLFNGAASHNRALALAARAIGSAAAVPVSVSAVGDIAVLLSIDGLSVAVGPCGAPFVPPATSGPAVSDDHLLGRAAVEGVGGRLRVGDWAGARRLARLAAALDPAWTDGVPMVVEVVAPPVGGDAARGALLGALIDTAPSDTGRWGHAAVEWSLDVDPTRCPGPLSP
jgi:hypothetical protein